ncbi:signal peptidase I [Bradyrhizobium embrapense]|uniref:signal peptidase I n=1 Tax=Bradyrhizobium embrapense TaxID=630921 RepID=UPI0007C455F1|nr:signal peptidase I [Bradyrhizobium embrapense]
MTLVQETGRRRPWGRILLIALLLIIALPILSPPLCRTFLFQPFSIPARSMMPTLEVGDNLFVSKFAYGYTHYSLPFSPKLFEGRIFGSSPARGDVVVFRLPKDDRVDYIKRVAGLPGDRIQMRDGQLYINETAVVRERMPDFVGDDACGSNGQSSARRWRETLPNNVSYETLDCIDHAYYDNTPVFTVPAGQFFMLGDNRDNSTDSRVPSMMGTIPLENIIGRAGLIYFSRSPEGVIRTGRMGTVVR